jgi:phage tail sheath protein FI
MPGSGPPVEETPVGPPTITGADLAYAFAALGPLVPATRLGGLRDLEAAFGPGPPGDPLATAVGLFFVNGGQALWASRAPTWPEALAGLDDAPPLGVIALCGEADEAAQEAALAYAEARRALLILDPPASIGDAAEAEAWLDSAAALAHPNAAAYFPRLLTAGGVVAASGPVAGVMARIELTRGVWKPPAGEEAALRGVAGLATALTGTQSDDLERRGLNPLRAFPDGRILVWGARTLAGEPASQWKYVSVRRLLLFLEHSIENGLQWVVFEPNGEALWAAVRRAIESFLYSLWRDGAFEGATAAQAFYVRCDRSTMTQSDIDNGRLVVEIGVAPLRPAEFVVLSIFHETADCA